MTLYLDCIPCLMFSHSWFIFIYALSSYMKKAIKYRYMVYYINNARYKCHWDSNYEYDKGCTIGFIITSTLLIIHSGQLNCVSPRNRKCLYALFKHTAALSFSFSWIWCVWNLSLPSRKNFIIFLKNVVVVVEYFWW